MKKKVHFIINPRSGNKSKDFLLPLIQQHLEADLFELNVEMTSSEQHTLHVARAAVESKVDVVVAVGGDGTMNNVARFVKGTDTCLALVPFGSGNGLARELGIPRNYEKAIQLIKNGKVRQIDTCIVNGHFFLNISGVGFDAHISQQFAQAGRRGLRTYAQLTLREFARYKPRNYELMLDGKSMKQQAFMVCVCNGTQFGNNAFISPRARLDDGKFQVTVFEKLRKRNLPIATFMLFNKRIDSLAFIQSYEAERISIRRSEIGVVNIDGEPVELGQELHFEIQPRNLNILVPESTRV